ncbi:MAG TPA: hypothetical protein VFZ38_17855 [Vicinamibacterales bacterium]
MSAIERELANEGEHLLKLQDRLDAATDDLRVVCRQNPVVGFLLGPVGFLAAAFARWHIRRWARDIVRDMERLQRINRP